MNRVLSIVFAASLLTQPTFAQKKAPENWFNLDQKKNKVPGVSTERAYNELLKNKTSQPIIVAVIDGGTEVSHEDLKDVIWVNEKEIPGNGIDDDNNGYIDDINGWSFLGGPGGDVVEETLEITRLARAAEQYKDKDRSTLSDEEIARLDLIMQATKQYNKKSEEAKQNATLYQSLVNTIASMQKHAGTENPKVAQLAGFEPKDPMEAALSKRLTELVKKGVKLTELSVQLQPAVEHYLSQVRYQLNKDFDPRHMVGDNPDDATEQFYGANRVSGPKGEHGTHVAGIIAAVRNNGIGMNGVANNVRIMVLRTVPDGDERDKDIANSIRYAVDNGAKIVNMSFGKDFSPDKKVIDDAVRYAEERNVLLVHAAGNDAKNTDTEPNFPRADYISDGTATNWIEVGASSWKKGKDIPATFSNYGKRNVDVFAPGVDIYSCIPESKYASYNGTSMAAPVTSGVAALVWSYYPQLSASDVKNIILQSAVPVKGKVIPPGGSKKQKTTMKELCKTGALVNAYQAILMAEKISAGK